MADFPFLSHLYGTYAFTVPAKPTAVKRVSNGTTFLTYDLAKDQYWCDRTGHSSNHAYLLGGSGPLWRNPSSYSRSGYRHEGVIAGKYKIGPLKSLYIDGECLDRTYVNIAFSNNDINPYFYPGQVHLLNYTNDEIINSLVMVEEKALSDLASSKASMGENLAQLNQTADLFGAIADATVDILRAAKALKRGNLKQIFSLNAKNLKRLVKQRKVERRVANYWLAYWYGLKPLVSDAQGLWELMKEQSKPVLLVHGRGRTRLEHTCSFTAMMSSTLSPSFSFVDVSSVRFQTHLTGKLNDAQIARLINRAGLLNLPALAWELVPFSFVIDWAVPVGQHLNNLTASSGLTFVGGSTTKTFDREVMASVAPGWEFGDSKPVSHYWGFGTNRSKLNKFPSGGLYVKPFFTGASRFATIAALISNLTADLKR